jgi:hypothetical protein
MLGTTKAAGAIVAALLISGNPLACHKFRNCSGPEKDWRMVQARVISKQTALGFAFDQF